MPTVACGLTDGQLAGFQIRERFGFMGHSFCDRIAKPEPILHRHSSIFNSRLILLPALQNHLIPERLPRCSSPAFWQALAAALSSRFLELDLRAFAEPIFRMMGLSKTTSRAYGETINERSYDW